MHSFYSISGIKSIIIMHLRRSLSSNNRPRNNHPNQIGVDEYKDRKSGGILYDACTVVQQQRRSRNNLTINWKEPHNPSDNSRKVPLSAKGTREYRNIHMIQVKINI